MKIWKEIFGNNNAEEGPIPIICCYKDYLELVKK